ncbi:DUF2147 domain-containing protein [Erythrobacter rubeus]|uniref:DUF2147 domain-containing protein n=1 Tax=Erythrobacter rubeus TaxID=2760803 RepID=A0ABR8KXN8_9SPHN|nr:DUF2147 domain-containing protein [Erythrobacter rubeus]MBD2842981.1 DUF2147 domain-containing protein [Erythrobacter rubeus]
MTMRLAAAATLTAALAAISSPAIAADSIAGRWLTEDEDAIVSIGKCGESTCGRIAKFIVPPPDGLDQRDINNPDPRLRKRKLLGLPVLFQFAEERDLWRGRIYDPKSGKDYRSVVRRKSANTLEVKGCIGPFCQTQIWRRAK